MGIFCPTASDTVPCIKAYKRGLAKGIPRFLPEEESCKEGTGQTGLNLLTNNLRLQLECRKESFRAEEKPKASRKISKLIFRSVQRLFTVRFAHRQASFAGLPGSGGQHACFALRLQLLRRHNVVFWFSFDAKENSPRPFPLPANSGLPGSGELRHPSNCGKLLVIHVAQHPPTAGPGWDSHPGGVWGKAPSHPPRPIPVCTAFVPRGKRVPFPFRFPGVLLPPLTRGGFFHIIYCIPIEIREAY